MSALPIRYLGWMTGDLIRSRGLPIVLLSAAAIFLAINAGGVEMLGSRRMAVVFVLLATSRIVSGDIANGYHRTLFARPVSPTLYYAQRWLVGAAVVLLAVLLVEFGLVTRLHIPPTGINIVARVGLLYLLLGGLVFLLSTLTRFDWLIASGLMFAQALIGTMKAGGVWTGPLWRATYAVLPPFHLVGLNTPVTWGSDLAYAGFYGAALVLGTIAVLRYRPLGVGSRD